MQQVKVEHIKTEPINTEQRNSSPKFEATVSASIFKQAQKTQLKTGTWKISPHGLSYQGHTRNDIPVMIELYLSPKEFKSYECKEEFLMGVNSQHFKTVMNSSDWTDTIDISVDDGVSHLDITIYNTRCGVRKTQTFSLKCTSPVQLRNFVDSRNENFLCELEMPSERYKDICFAMRKLSDCTNDIMISMLPEKVLFEGWGDAKCIKSAVTITPKGNDYTYRYSKDVGAPFRNIMLNYPTFNVFLNEKISLKFTDDKILVAEYKILKCGFLRYYMGPKTSHKFSKRKGNVKVKNEIKRARFFN